MHKALTACDSSALNDPYEQDLQRSGLGTEPSSVFRNFIKLNVQRADCCRTDMPLGENLLLLLLNQEQKPQEAEGAHQVH
jgi:hypothetical protein